MNSWRPRPFGARRRARAHERGAALITALLCMTLLFALGLALLLSTTTDTLISANFRSSEEAFFAADAGVAVGRRAVAKAISEQITAIAAGKAPAFHPDSQVLPDSNTAPDAPFFRTIIDRTAEIANDKNRCKLPNDSKFQIEVLEIKGGPTTDPVRNPRNGLENYTFSYVIRSTGRSATDARAEVVERGELTTYLTASVSVTRQPFSAYGTFFDRGNPDGGMVLVSGTFTGPVHTNSHLSFSSKNTVVFRDRVSQAEDNIEYDGQMIPIPDAGKPGIVVSQGAFVKKPKVPLPANNFVQELAVVNGTGLPGGGDGSMVDGNGRVTPQALADGLTDASGRPPVPDANGIPKGVYISSSDGVEVTGGGIYVNGDAQIDLSASGNTQVITVTQGGQSTTVTVDYTANNTTISSGGTSRSLTGVPTDSSLGEAQATPGISLFVNGSVTSLSGPPAVDDQTGAALSPQTAMTITAQRDITITGDLKYTDPVVASDGTPLPRANQNAAILGIYTNDGNVVLQPNPSRTDGNGSSLEIDAAIAAFNANPGNDNGKPEGTIIYGSGTPAAGSRLTIIGARLQSNIGNIKYRKRQIFFDPRLSGGQFAPPFFPGIEIKRNTSDLVVNFPGERAIVILADAWQRDEKRPKSN
ncbi:MAG TPA: PilX N-terminal domain-containing pilus assembly protein [Blastocatellia bacterium]|nr:PilX N-terminal domain-containing pilus assembly protein [Blastocatellia bacterium]